ncbi:MAG TPA: 30S ribosomal protein S15 [Clostridiales bacterium]|jgi:small subunit ribosomal protein S15|nr:30S ribosomal protein S15 [Clostridiales bacterium]HQP70131.1 30S ribosomal protein S15 [Clostridiales bacterium]
MISKEVKAEIMKKYGSTPTDSGRPEVQIVIISTRVKELTNHLMANKKDNHSRRGLRLMLGQRGKLLKYLKALDIARYRALIKDLELKDRY